MNVTKKRLRNMLSFALAFLILCSTTNLFHFSAIETSETSISYVFSGVNASDSGYAEGTLSFTSENSGTYYLYWADDTKALDGYYEIESFNISSGKSQSFEFGDHTAIPVGATKIIAVTDKSDLSVSNAVAVYSLPENKQLRKENNNLLYTFNSYSDVHIDETGYYKNDTKNWKQALKYAVAKNTDFIVSSGDMTSSTGGADADWVVYEQILADSNYVNPIWESDGNHDLYCGADVE